MASQRKPVPSTAKPQHGEVFDPWNSTATGHQQSDTRPGLGWRDSRNKKLMSQFTAGHSGGARLSDSYGAGSEDYDERLGMVVPKAVKARAKLSVKDMLAIPGSMKETLCSNVEKSSSNPGLARADKISAQLQKEDEPCNDQPRNSGIFRGLVIYVNGSTAPLISDHKLKRILADNGAKMSLHLGRRQVTHVIVGRPVGNSLGSGGGLAGGKLEKEIKKIGGRGLKFVGVEWVLESLKAGKRLPESRFATLKMARDRQQSVLETYTPVSDRSRLDPTGTKPMG